MKQANILGGANSYSNGFSERPNYLSPVIQSFSTTVMSHTPSVNNRGEPDMTFDLDNISKFFNIIFISLKKKSIISSKCQNPL